MSMVVTQTNKRAYEGNNVALRLRPGSTAYSRNGYPRSTNKSYSSGHSRGSRRDKFKNYTHANPVYPKPEIKTFDILFGNVAVPYAIPSPPAVSMLNYIAAGTQSNQRLGQQVSTKSVYYQFVATIGGTPTPTACRYILFWDRYPKGVQFPPVTDILASTNFITSPMNLANRDRFIFLADERFCLSPQGETVRTIEGYRKINQISTYSEPPPNPPIPNTGGLGFLFVSDEITTTTYPGIVGQWRIRYIDN